VALPAPRTAAAKKRAGSKHIAALPADHTPSEAAAHALVDGYPDLEPSVNRILNAGLDEAGRMHAIELFQASLAVPGDPNRIPANAIAAARLL
jgi:hypothetical protein